MEALNPQSPRHFAWQPSTRVSQTLQSSYFGHMIAATKYADEYCPLHRFDYRKTLTYPHTTSRTLPTCDSSLGSLTLTASEAGNFLELLLP
jgi:hypothetical protein